MKCGQASQPGRGGICSTAKRLSSTTTPRFFTARPSVYGGTYHGAILLFLRLKAGLSQGNGAASNYYNDNSIYTYIYINYLLGKRFLGCSIVLPGTMETPNLAGC